MNIEKSRKEFEEWYLAEFYEGDKQCGLEWLSTEPCGGYRYSAPAESWKAWQASRAALVIELPYVPSYPAHEAASDQDYYLDEAKADIRQQCKQAIEAAGVRVAK